MKQLISSLFTVALLFSTTAQTVSFSAKTGDKELDLTLSDMNASASTNYTVFKNDMKVTYNVTDKKIDELKLTFKMQPADIFMSLEIAKLTQKTIDDVARAFQINRDKGWGEIAKQMGIKPGSKEFHALKGTAKGKNNNAKKGGEASKGKPGPSKATPSGSAGKK
ncbi:MAG: hypothetical protein ACK4K0_01330 [Flavobacteriales bacterium]